MMEGDRTRSSMVRDVRGAVASLRTAIGILLSAVPLPLSVSSRRLAGHCAGGRWLGEGGGESSKLIQQVSSVGVENKWKGKEAGNVIVRCLRFGKSKTSGNVNILIVSEVQWESDAKRCDCA